MRHRQAQVCPPPPPLQNLDLETEFNAGGRFKFCRGGGGASTYPAGIETEFNAGGRFKFCRGGGGGGVLPHILYGIETEFNAGG